LRVESGEWRVESGEWRVESYVCGNDRDVSITLNMVNRNKINIKKIISCH